MHCPALLVKAWHIQHPTCHQLTQLSQYCHCACHTTVLCFAYLYPCFAYLDLCFAYSNLCFADLDLCFIASDSAPTAMQDVDASTSHQAGTPQAAVHVPRPTAKETWDAMHQTSQALDQKEGIVQGTNQPVTVLVSFPTCHWRSCNVFAMSNVQ